MTKKKMLDFVQKFLAGIRPVDGVASFQMSRGGKKGKSSTDDKFEK